MEPLQVAEARAMRVLFRADASVEIGSGHVVRCRTLAEALRGDGAEVTFACRNLPGDLNGWLREQGFETLSWDADSPEEVPLLLSERLKQERFDWIVVDHYGLGAHWETPLRSAGSRVLVIDDLANRAHNCDLLLDQNYFAQPESRYEGLTPAGCQRLLGPAYALLRPEFHTVRKQVLQSGKRQSGKLERIQVFFGGSDPAGETFRALDAIQQAGLSGLSVDVIVGASNPRREELRAFCEGRRNTAFYCQTDRMPELMAQADLAVSAGGTATWERLCLGLPAIVISVAENQERISGEVADTGAQVYLGRSGEVGIEPLVAALNSFQETPGLLSAMSEAAWPLVDGLGTRKVIQAMLG